MATYEIRFRKSVNQRFSFDYGGATWLCRVVYCNAPDGCGGWTLDIANNLGVPVAQGIPLVTGVNLLDAIPEIGFPPGTSLLVQTDGEDVDAVPGYADLGQATHLRISP